MVMALANVLLATALLTLPGFGSCGFFGTKNALVLTRPESSISLFGYKVASVRTDRGIQLFMTDPTAKNSYTNATSGAVYNCSIAADDFGKTRQACDTQLPLNYKPSSTKISDVNSSCFQFGASLDTLDSGHLVACAPGYNFRMPNDSRTYTPGLCGYWNLGAGHQPVWKSGLTDYKNTDNEDEMFGHCMGGFQVALQVDKDVAKVAVSGPLCLKRRVAVWQVDSTSRCSLDLQLLSQWPQTLGSSILPNPQASNFFVFASQVKDNKLAVTLQDNNCQHGSASIQSSAIPNSPFISFGYSAIFINNLEEMQMVVSAPFGSSDNAYGGCIYVLSKMGGEYNLIAKYCHQEPNARFGTSLANLGNVDNEGFEDFAVGCPGCGVSGQVFVFFGEKSYQDREIKPMQIINGTDVSPNLSGFGWSLAKVAGNGEKQSVSLAVSSIYSQHVVVLPGSTLSKLEFEGGDSEFSVLDKDIRQKIQLKLKFTSDSSNYQYQLIVRFLEVPYNGINRFSIEINDPSLKHIGEGWYRVTVQRKIKFMHKYAINYQLKPVRNTNHYIPFDKLLKPFSIQMFGMIVNQSSLDGTPFPTIKFSGSIIKNNQFVLTSHSRPRALQDSSLFQVKFDLLSPSYVVLNTMETVVVELKVTRVSRRKFAGGAGIRIRASAGVTILEDVRVLSDGKNRTAKYWPEQQELYFADTFSAAISSIEFQNDIKVSIRMRFSGLLTKYVTSFQLFSIRDLTQGYCKDCSAAFMEADKLNTTMEVMYNSSLNMGLAGSTESDYVHDMRTEAANLDWRTLGKTILGSQLGPPLRQTYTLEAKTMPLRQVSNVTITMKVPLITVHNELLLYFGKSMLDTNSLRKNSYLPGRPYLSSSENPDKFTECRVLEPDLADVINQMDAILMESAHVENVSETQTAQVRHRREVSEEEEEEDSNSSPTSGSRSGSSNRKHVKDELDCERMNLTKLNFRCVTFVCDVPPMMTQAREGNSGQVKLHVHARVWSSTFMSYKRFLFKITSRARVQPPKFDQFAVVDIVSESKVTQTFDFWSMTNQSEPFPWWYVILAIFCGIWLLLLLILLLWYCNFFARKKFDYAQVPQKPTNDDEDFYR